MIQNQKENETLLHDLNGELTMVMDVFYRLEKGIMKGTLTTENAKDAILEMLNNGKKRVLGISEFMKEAISPKVDFEDIARMHVKNHGGIEIKITNISNSKYLMKRIHINRILNNIISNAVEAQATVLKIAINKDSIVFMDDGEGFSKGVASSINSGKQITTRDNGHGIGTISVKKLARSYKLEMTCCNGLNGANIAFNKTA